jgi:hypothetical protein
MIILSIIIPTFDRHCELEISLQNLVKLFDQYDFKNKIEILVLDNTPHHFKAMTLFTQKNTETPNVIFRYIKNKKNLGFDGNCYKGLTEAKGDYVWFLSDRYSIYFEPNTLVYALKKGACSYMFSDTFRKYFKAPDFINSYSDKHIFNELCAEDTFLLCEPNVIEPYIKDGLINSISDLIFKKPIPVDVISEFRDTHMLAVAAQLNGYKSSRTIGIIPVHQNIVTQKTIGADRELTRHNYWEVYQSSSLLAKHFSFLGSSSELKAQGFYNIVQLKIKLNIGSYGYKYDFGLFNVLKAYLQNFFKLNMIQHFEFLIAFILPVRICSLAYLRLKLLLKTVIS